LSLRSLTSLWAVGALCVTALLVHACGSGPRAAVRTIAPADPQMRATRYLVMRDYAPDDTGLAGGRTLAYSAGRRFADALEAQIKQLGYDITDNILAGGDIEVTLEILMPGPNTLEPLETSVFASAWVGGRRIASTSIPFKPRKDLTRADLDTALELITRPAVLSSVQEHAKQAAEDREHAQAEARQQAEALALARQQAEQAARAGEGAVAQQRVEALTRQHSDANANAEQRAWSNAKKSTCLAAQTDDACEGVAKYLKGYPSGAHASEARRAQAKGRSNMTERSYFTEAVGAIQRDPDARELIVKSGLCNWPCGTYRPKLLSLAQDLSSQCGAKCKCCEFCQGQCGINNTQTDARVSEASGLFDPERVCDDERDDSMVVSAP
jgi:hypothetical protein